nr:MAG TPA: DNA-directed RNA polymerase [Caudoviricetes sp.]
MFIFGVPIRENRQAFSSETKNTRYMKKLSIALLALTTVQAAMTGEGTALIVAFVLFCHTCGKDVVRIWNKYFN